MIILPLLNVSSRTASVYGKILLSLNSTSRFPAQWRQKIYKFTNTCSWLQYRPIQHDVNTMNIIHVILYELSKYEYYCFCFLHCKINAKKCLVIPSLLSGSAKSEISVSGNKVLHMFH